MNATRRPSGENVGSAEPAYALSTEDQSMISPVVGETKVTPFSRESRMPAGLVASQFPSGDQAMRRRLRVHSTTCRSAPQIDETTTSLGVVLAFVAFVLAGTCQKAIDFPSCENAGNACEPASSVSRKGVALPPICC